LLKSRIQKIRQQQFAMTSTRTNALKQGLLASNEHLPIPAERVAELTSCLHDLDAALQHAAANPGSRNRMGSCFSGCLVGSKSKQTDSKVRTLKIKCQKICDSLTESQTCAEKVFRDFTQKVDQLMPEHTTTEASAVAEMILLGASQKSHDTQGSLYIVHHLIAQLSNPNNELAKAVANQKQMVKDVSDFTAAAQASLLDTGSLCLSRPSTTSATLLKKLQEVRLVVEQLDASNCTSAFNLSFDQMDSSDSESIGTIPAVDSKQHVWQLGDSATSTEAELPNGSAPAQNSDARRIRFEVVAADATELATKQPHLFETACAGTTEQSATADADGPESTLSAIIEEHTQPSTFGGLILKQSPALHRFGGYQQRFVKLTAGQISWSLVDSDGTAGQLKGFADLAGNICQAEEGSKSHFIIRPQDGERWQGFNTFKAGRKYRTLRFDVSESTHTLEQWIEAVRAHIVCCDKRFGLESSPAKQSSKLGGG